MNSQESQARIKERVNTIIDLITMGMSTQMLYEYSKQQKWGVTERTIDNYIHKANEHFKKISDVKREESYGLLVDRYRDLYFKSQRKKDYKTCSQINDKLAKLLGFEQVKNVLNNDINIEVNFGFNKKDPIKE